MTFSSNGFCWAGSINARQKHKFPNGIRKLKLENYNSFLKYKLFPGLKYFLKEKEHNLKILNFYLKKLSTYLMNLGHSLHCALSTIDLRGIPTNWLKLSFRLSRLYGLTGVSQFALIRLSSARIVHWITVYRLYIQKWKYIILSSLGYLKMEIYNSLQGNIFHIEEFIIHISEEKGNL